MSERFEYLADRFVRNDLEEAEIAELADLIEGDDELASRLRDNFVMDGLLMDLSGQTISVQKRAIISQVVPLRMRLTMRHFIAVSIILIALFTLIGAPFIFIQNTLLSSYNIKSIDRQFLRLAKKKSVNSGPVANIARLEGVVWKENAPTYQAGDLLTPGWLRIKSGTVYLEFFCGADVILTGPTDFMVVSNDLAWCSQGEVMANVPPQAIGFTINVPQMSVIDRGTEFRLNVTPTISEVHVLKGMVELDRLPDGLKQVEAGSGMAVETGGNNHPITVQKVKYRSVVDMMNENVVTETRERIERWRKAVEKINADPATLLRFDMTPSVDNFRSIPNLVNATPNSPADGIRVSCSTGIGFLSCNTSLEFRRVSDRVRLIVPNELDSFTLFARVRLDSPSNSDNCLLMTDGTRARGIGWQITKKGFISLVVYDEKSDQSFRYDARITDLKQVLGRWVTLCCVVDTEKKTVEHYINGKSLGELRLQHNFPVQIGMAELGNWNRSFEATTTESYLHGALDEFVISTRPWDSKEMQY